MTLRPLHRRVSFWLGLFVVLSLGWAWRDSYRTMRDMALSGDGHVLRFARMGGKSSVYLHGDAHARAMHFDVQSSKVDSRGGILLKRPIDWLIERPRFTIPDSLVFFSFVGLWIGWLVWRRKAGDGMHSAKENA